MTPSTDLPPVPGTSSPTVIRSTLETIRSTCLGPVTVDLRSPLEVTDFEPEDGPAERQGDDDGEGRDDFEGRVLREWLGRVMRFALKQPATRGASEDGATWEAIVDEASAILSGLEEDQAETTYILPAAGPSSHVMTIDIHNHTLVSSTTGHRTWGSAPILARRMAVEPARFFPMKMPSQRLEVLELGSGTGLVGISAIATLDALGFLNATVTLSDGGETNLDAVSTGGILHNLRRNVDNYRSTRAKEGTDVRSEVCSLMWGQSFARDGTPTEGGGLPDDFRYDVILGADLVYEPTQGLALRQAVAEHLRFPRPSDASSGFAPAFHLVIPLRPTHVRESDLVDTLFPSHCAPSLSSDTHPLVMRASDGKRWTLVTKEREDLAGPDGFGREGAHGRGQRGGRCEKIIRYRKWRIAWDEVKTV